MVRAMKVIMPDIMKVEYNVRVLQEAETLRNVGHDVVVVGFSNKSKKRNFTINDIPIVSFYLHDGRKGVSRLIRYVTAFKMILGINFYVIFQKADVYHAHNFHVLPACWFSAFIHGGKLIYDTHETWTVHKNRKYHPEHIFAFIVEKLFLRFITRFITVNEMVADYYKTKYDVNNATILYNTRKILPLVKKDLIRKDLNLQKSKKIALFVGGFWPNGRGIMELIQSSEFLNGNIAIVLIGYGSEQMLQKMNDEIERYDGQDKVFILPGQPPDKLMDYVMSADIGMNLIKRESQAQDFQSPWKLFEYCMSGLAVVSTDLPFHRKVYGKFKIGEFCDKDNSPKSIATQIKLLLKDRKRLAQFKKNARKAAEEEFNWKVQEEKLLKLYAEITTH